MDTVGQMTVAEVKAFYHKHFKPSSAQIIAVSSMEQKQLKQQLAGFKGWTGTAPELNLNLPMPAHKELTVYLVNKDKAAQSAIRIGKRGLKQDITGEFYQAQLMNFALGGNFNSRINLNLREDKGYTYGARTGFWGDKLAGGFTAMASVRADATDKSIIEFANEIKQYHSKGIQADELSFTKSAINQKDALKYETPDAKLVFLAQILEHNLSPGFVKERAKILSNMSAEQVNGLAAKHLDLNQMLMVVVGDAKVLRPQLEALGYTVKDFAI
jgi:zinc protease